MIPVPELEDDAQIRLRQPDRARMRSSSIAVVIGDRKTVKDARPVIKWLRARTGRRRRGTGAGPARSDASAQTPRRLWGLGVVIFSDPELRRIDPRLALVVAIAGIFSGLGTCASSATWSPNARPARSRGVRLRMAPRSPGGARRDDSRDAGVGDLSTGVPILGVALIAAGVAIGVLPKTDDSWCSRR